MESWFDCRQDNRFFSVHQIVKTGSQSNPLSYVKCTGDIFSRVKVARSFDIAIICTEFLPGILWSCYWILEHAGVRGNEIAGKLARGDCVQKFVGPEPFLGVSKQNIRDKFIRWVDNQHSAMWCGPASTHRQAR